MQRRHFELIAKAIAEEVALSHHGSRDRGTLKALALRLASDLATTNPNFNRQRFLKACDIKETDHA